MLAHCPAPPSYFPRALPTGTPLRAPHTQHWSTIWVPYVPPPPHERAHRHTLSTCYGNEVRSAGPTSTLKFFFLLPVVGFNIQVTTISWLYVGAKETIMVIYVRKRAGPLSLASKHLAPALYKTWGTLYRCSCLHSTT